MRPKSLVELAAIRRREEMVSASKLQREIIPSEHRAKHHTPCKTEGCEGLASRYSISGRCRPCRTRRRVSSANECTSSSLPSQPKRGD